MTIYKTFENPHPRVKFMTNIVDAYGPYRFFLTLTFNYPLNDENGTLAASQLVRRLNKKILGKHWKKHDVQSLRGIATLERTKLRRSDAAGKLTRDKASCHFHFLIKDHDALPRDDVAAMSMVKASFETVARALNLNRCSKLVGRDGAVVRAVETLGVNGYVVKHARSDGWSSQNRFFLLEDSGLLPIFADELLGWIDFSQTKRRAAESFFD